ncbi:MAG: aminopeptidase P family protein [Firmicutes bacterium]|nr:aminopeptidase P family protein [Bacillota bacterium]
MFSKQEKHRRLGAAADLIRKEGLNGIYLLGNGTVGTNAFGNFRYFTDNRVFFFLQSALITPDEKLIAVVGSQMAMLNLRGRSFVDDFVVNGDQVGGIIKYLKDNGLEKGRLGVIKELLPSPWYIRLMNELPETELVDVSPELFAIRTDKSEEESDALRMCGRIADAGYEAFKKAAVPGAYEHEVVAETIKAMQAMGADSYFMLIASGRFSREESKLTTLHNTAGIDRRLEKGDSVSMEITPYFNGNWTQFVRTISVGEYNPDVDEFRAVIIKGIDAAAKVMKAGVPICEAIKAMRAAVEAEGYRLEMPVGHICGADLNEERTTEDNERPLRKGMSVILHPTVLNDKLKSGIYWGESYLITEDGCECLMEGSRELFCTE